MRPANAGFTLLEVLVAVALSSVAMMALFSMFDTVTDVAADVAQREEAAYGERAFESILFDDLRSLYVNKNVANTGEFGFVGNDSGFLDEESRLLAFASSASLNSRGEEPSLSLQRIEYVIREEEEGRTLVRRERPFCGLDGDWEFVDVVVLEGFTDLTMEYFNPTDHTYVDEWQGSSLPLAVRVEVEHGDQRRTSFVVELSDMAVGIR